MPVGTVNKRLGDFLVSAGMITVEQLKDALETQKQYGGKLGKILSQMGFLNEEVMLAFLGKQCGISYVSLTEYGEIAEEALKSVPESIVRCQSLIPIAKTNNTITIAMSDPFNIFAIDDIKVMTGLEVKAVITSELEIRNAVKKYYSAGSGLEHDLLETYNRLKAGNAKPALIGEALFNNLLNQAMACRASIVYVEPELDIVRIRYRIDGVLREQSFISKEIMDAFTNHIQSLGNFDLSNSPISKEARIYTKLGQKNLDLYVSIVPTILGKRTVIRIRNADFFESDIDKLGFEPEALAVYKKRACSRRGLILVTGPIDSGRTMTLYSTLSFLNGSCRDIATIEDPVKYLIPGITQVQLETGNADYSSAFDSLLRQAPDVILLQELNSKEMILKALSAAQRGHLILSTLFSNNCLDAIFQLKSMGIEPYAISSSVLAIVNQRLMRVICTHCKEKYEVARQNLAAITGLPESFDEPGKIMLYRGRGCEKCNNTGYNGRTAIYEVLEFTDHIKALINGGPNELLLENAAIKEGFVPLIEAAWKKVKLGITSFEEMTRVV
jgi:type IV pilus assembly protein PilB